MTTAFTPSYIREVDRRSFIGASEVARIFSPRAADVWASKTCDLEPEPDLDENDPRAIGHSLENAILDNHELAIDSAIGARQTRIAIAGTPMVATVDGITLAGGRRVPIEAKTSGILWPARNRDEWGEDGSDSIPQDYQIQVTVQAKAVEADEAHVAALIGGRGFARFVVPFDPELMQMLGDGVCDFWERYVKTCTMPGPEWYGSRLSVAVAKRMKREPGSIVRIGQEQAEAFALWESAKVEASMREKDKKRFESEVWGLLGTAEAALLPDGRMYQVQTVNRKGYTVEPSSYRQLKPMKGTNECIRT